MAGPAGAWRSREFEFYTDVVLRWSSFRGQVLRALLRTLALTLTALLVANAPFVSALDCCSISSLESKLGGEAECCEDSCESSASHGSESGSHCPCPLPCGPGCTGHGQRALAGRFVFSMDPRAAEVAENAWTPPERPLAPEPDEILHIPKLFRA